MEKPSSNANQISQPVFFPVSVTKLIVMSILTFGIYDLYWFYKNWKFVKARKNKNIMPFLRAFFAIFCCYSLFKEIKNVATTYNVKSSFYPSLIAVTWITLRLCAQLPDPYWLINGVSVIALLPIQRLVNKLNIKVAPGHDQNINFSFGNVVIIIIGILLWILVVLGLVISE